MSLKGRSERIIALAHVTRAAGTTLIHLLREHFGLRHLDVSPANKLVTYTHVFYGPIDLRRDLKLYPSVESLSGHLLKPFVDFEEFQERLVWYTVLRRPMDRLLSHYQREIDKQIWQGDLRSWLQNCVVPNQQVRQLAGEQDLEAAKQILSSRIRCVGLVEKFDASLLMIRRRLSIDFDVQYRKPKNVGKEAVRRRVEENLEDYSDDIMEHNALDEELYQFATEEIWPKQVAEYGEERLRTDLEARFQQGRSKIKKRWRFWTNRFYWYLVYRPYLRSGLQAASISSRLGIFR